MSDLERTVAAHYTGDGSALDRILSTLAEAGIDPNRLDPEMLTGVDEFHSGGHAATLALVADLGLAERSRVLDVGCGIGGAARTLARETASTVVGIDLTSAYVEVAIALSGRTGLADRTSFFVGSATALDVESGSFDAVTMFHVGMNIEDKRLLMAELARAVRPGGRVAVYDLMRVGDGELSYPMPWAGDASSSFVATPDVYLAAMRSAGLEPGEPVDRRDLVAEATRAAAETPPPVDLHALIGPERKARFANIGAATVGGLVAPTQIIATKT